MPGVDDGRPSDADVIVSSLQNPDVFTVLFERHASAVFKFVSRQVSPAAAGDLLSETFATAFRVRHRYDSSVSNAKPWLFGIAANVGRHHQRSELRRRRMRDRIRERASSALEETDRADERLDATRQRRHLADALRSLSPAHREVVLLFASFDLSYEEISRELGIPMGTVRSRLSRARSELREHLRASGQHGLVGEAPTVTDRGAGEGHG